jgi:hypothetical protein
VPTTLAAFAVAAYAVLPGAAFIYAYRAQAGAYGRDLPDRITRFLLVSLLLQVLFSFVTYAVYRDVILTGRLQRGEVPLVWLWVTALCLVAVPFGLGWIAGMAVRHNWLSIRAIVSGTVEPRAWDHVFQLHKPHGLVRLRMKSGIYVAGIFGRSHAASQPDGFPNSSHASGYPEAGDLYLYETLVVDPSTGVPELDATGSYIPYGGGLLVRWEDVELIEMFRSRQS